MLDIILIDDEKFALQLLQQELCLFDDINIIAECQSGYNALKIIENTTVDAIFVDINMPDITGIEFLNEINRRSIRTKVIFTTAYDHYALDAFELGAFDYIMKPVTHNRLAKTFSRIKELNSLVLPEQLIIKGFKSFSITYQNTPLKWRTSKAKELVAYLLVNNGEIHQNQILDDLWDEKKETSQGYLHSIVYYARKTFKEAGFSQAITYQNKHYSLTLPPDSYSFDIEVFTEFCTNTPLFMFDDIILNKAVQLHDNYSGGLFEQDQYVWCHKQQLNLEKYHETLLYYIAKYYYKKKDFISAYKYITKLIDLNAFNDDAHHLLLNIYQDSDDHIGYHQYLEKINDLYLSELNIKFLSKE